MLRSDVWLVRQFGARSVLFAAFCRFAALRVTTTSSMPPVLLCLGDPLLDIQVSESAQGLIAKYNLKPNDAIRATQEHASLCVFFH